MPRASHGCSLHVRRAGLADVGSSDDRPHLHSVARSHSKIRVELQQARTQKMGDTYPALATRKPYRPRLLRQRRRRRRPAKRAYTSGNARLNTVGAGLRNATGSFSWHTEGESDARTRSHSESWRETEFCTKCFRSAGRFRTAFNSVSRFELV